MFAKLFFVFAILPILEIMLLLNVSENIGGWNTFALVVVTAFLGAFFVRREGTATLASVQKKLAEGDMPSKELSEGLLLIVAGVLLVTPGFITDLAGLVFTLPITRAPIAKSLVNQFLNTSHTNVHFTAYNSHTEQSPFSSTTENHSKDNHNEGDVFEGEFTDKTNPSENKHKKIG